MKIKSLYVNGDSFSFGQELGTAAFDKFDDYKKNNCYSGIIFNSLKLEDYQNNSAPGGSNERIYRTLIDDIYEKLKYYKPEEIFCLIGLTHASRREFCFDETGKYMLFLPNFKPYKGKSFLTDLWEVLMMHFTNKFGIYSFDFMITLAIQNFLRSLKIPYLITYSIKHGIDISDESSVLSQEKKNFLIHQHRILNYPSFMIFNNDLNLPTGPELHPLEDGHKAWAKFLINLINDKNLFSTSDL